MSLLLQLSEASAWESFYEYKTSLACPKQFAKRLRDFIDGQEYLPIVRRIQAGEPFPLPRRAVISKESSTKKRTVYVYPEAENIVLKLLTHLLLRRYDGLFSRGLYSFRPGRSAKDAIRFLTSVPDLKDRFAYKVDVSNYFNSIPLTQFLPMLENALSDDPELYSFLSALLSEPEVLERGKPIREEKGIMAGTPLASFYANLYLRGLDRHFAEQNVPYVRYSDDIILFAKTEEECHAYAEEIRNYLKERGLSVNPDKESFTGPEDGFVFLGFSVKGGVIDIAPNSVRKLKKKMRRKARALLRWRERNGIDGEKAAKAFIRVFNRKLLESAGDNDLTWSYWFFSVINTAKSLRVIDRYAADCLRFLISGRRTKGRFDVRYEDLKALGFKSLVHAYYDFSGTPESTQKIHEKALQRHGKCDSIN